jgi:large subunit ribosomal protein L15
MPLQRRLPKRGFRNPFRVEYAVVNLKKIDERFEPHATVDPDSLYAAGMVSKGMLVKILAHGDVTKPFTVRAHAFSASARARLEGAGGTIEVIARA